VRLVVIGVTATFRL